MAFPRYLPWPLWLYTCSYRLTERYKKAESLSNWAKRKMADAFIFKLYKLRRDTSHQCFIIVVTDNRKYWNVNLLIYNLHTQHSNISKALDNIFKDLSIPPFGYVSHCPAKWVSFGGKGPHLRRWLVEKLSSIRVARSPGVAWVLWIDLRLT